ncbi:hypothetical protein [Shewanella waksmanii]|uniref:hypothetical protein n=1 Tax=Shewanella waksmanii TaxID=213783 RepID=UPI00048F463A|nr:hypothetical protein [Shewanella waksmanii]
MPTIAAKKRRYAPRFIVLFSVALIAFGHYVYLYDKDQIFLQCQADAYIAATETDLQIGLEIKSLADEFSMDYQFLTDGEVIGEITLDGMLTQLQYGDMTYKATLNEGQFNIDLSSMYIPPYMKNIIDFSSERMVDDSEIEVDIRVLVTDPKQGYSIIQLLPGESIWVCHN